MALIPAHEKDIFPHIPPRIFLKTFYILPKMFFCYDALFGFLCTELHPAIVI
jgi:hypothetical protein